jgi:hypothetical protein
MHGNNTRNLPYSYVHLKLTKTPCFPYDLLHFFFYKIGLQEGKIGSVRRQEGRGVGKGGAQIMYTHVSKGKSNKNNKNK